MNLDTTGIITVILVILGFCLLTGFTIWLRDKTKAPAAPKIEIKEDPRQIGIRITCDDGHTADFLRELANHIEERDEDDFDFEYESFHGCAEITTED